MNTKQRCTAQGKQTEDHFQQTMIKMGVECTKASDHDDIHNHIDFYLGETTVDVKSNAYSNAIWLELTNVLGNDGWLKGKASYIAFKLSCDKPSYLFFRRIDLLNYVLENNTGKTTKKTDLYKLYTRKGRKDEVMKTTLLDIKKYLVKSVPILHEP